MKAHIILYADEFDTDVWEEYCGIADVPDSATEIIIPFDTKKVVYKTARDNDEEEEEEVED